MRNTMMKRIRTALCLILAAALLAGCAFLPSDSEPETLAPTDPLTGLALEWQGPRPGAGGIENNHAPTTQRGLFSALVGLEALNQGGTSPEVRPFFPALAPAPQGRRLLGGGHPPPNPRAAGLGEGRRRLPHFPRPGGEIRH